MYGFLAYNVRKGKERVMTQQSIAEALRAYADSVHRSRCPWCGHTDWDDGVATLAPIIPDDTPFDTNAPFQHNALLAILVFTCQQCRYALTFSPGGLLALKERPGSDESSG